MSDLAPDYLEPVVGWRAWRVEPTPAGSRLRSVTRGDLWPVDGPLAAGCPHQELFRHSAPGVGCRCGIYAARDAEAAAYYTAHASSHERAMAIGHVELWGAVIEGEEGWRASHAYPRRILVLTPRGVTGLGDRLAIAAGLGDYGVPVELLDLPRAAVTGRVILDWATTHDALTFADV